MNKTLYLAIQPFVYEGKSGALTVKNKSGDTASIFLKDGMVGAIEACGQKGISAAKIIVTWVNITTEFKSGIDIPIEENEVDTSYFMDLLEKINKKLNTVLKFVPGGDAIFKISSVKLNKQNKFSGSDLRISLLLDGKKSVNRVIEESNLSELEVYLTIYKLTFAGIAQLLTSKKPMAAEKRKIFLDGLQKTLAELIGPVAGTLISDAFDHMKTNPELLSKECAINLINELKKLLDEKESITIETWASNNLPT